MKNECMHDVIGGTKEAFGLAILRRRVWAGETISDAVEGEKRSEGVVDELTPVITLHGLNHDVVLCAHKREEALESGGRV